MKLIGIISDTHGTLDPRAFAALAECDYIIHAGDIGDPGIYNELKTLAPVTAVLGNNDLDEYGSEVGQSANPTIDGVNFLVTHYPPHYQESAFKSLGLQPGDPVPDVGIHGHTHVPRIAIGHNARPAGLLLCPGSASRPRKRSPRCVAYMRVDDGHFIGAQIVSLDGEALLSIGDPI